MIRIRVIFFLIGSFYHLSVHAQISPGPLAKAHTSLEGIANCTKCHDIGKKVTNEKCLACHLEIQSRMDAHKGYHAASEVKQKTCVQCHNDHHGVTFELVHFDKSKFDHTLTGYRLTGKHSTISCNDCHQAKFITQEKFKKSNSYLGVNDQCVTCHVDVHRNTMDQNCALCHNTQSFKPADKFDHNKTHYPLLGKHQTVRCESCHKLNQSNPKSIIFEGIAHQQCSSCHENVHGHKFGSSCNICHNEASFAQINRLNQFNHSQTGFILKGKHKIINCNACHLASWTSIKTAFLDFNHKPVNHCTACHKDVHESKFGDDCIKCHNENSFKIKQVSSDFNHDLTHFKLEGKHASVACNQCHKGKMTDPLRHDACADCHSDYHHGEFKQFNSSPDCSSCHTVSTFNEVLYGIDRHSQSSFPLKGAHLAIACDQCHKRDSVWRFRKIGERCVDCHTDVHAVDLDQKYYPQQSCISCHQNESWSIIKFEHISTGYELTGRHIALDCTTCHKKEKGDQKLHIGFKLTSSSCNSCHEDIHLGQFKPIAATETECTRCHQTTHWKPSLFNHNLAAFKLDGKHKDVACDKCHKLSFKDGKNAVQYKLASFKCVDCHKK